MTINIFMYIYIGENAHRDIYAPPCKSLHKKKIHFFFHFRCILLQRSHKKCFFISISILGRSGVNRSVITVHTNLFAKKTRKLHKFATTNSNFEKINFSDMCPRTRVFIFIYAHDKKSCLMLVRGS